MILKQPFCEIKSPYDPCPSEVFTYTILSGYFQGLHISRIGSISISRMAAIPNIFLILAKYFKLLYFTN